MYSFLTYLSCRIGLCPTPEATVDSHKNIAKPAVIEISDVETLRQENIQRIMASNFNQNSVAGNYLAGQFAQRRQDWKRAGEYMVRFR